VETHPRSGKPAYNDIVENAENAENVENVKNDLGKFPLDLKNLGVEL
jgi:hypothetical protein